MIVKMFSLYDCLVGFYHKPVFQRNKGEAVRSLSNSVNVPADKDNGINTHPEQYVLYEIGEFDDETGKVTVYQVPECIGKAIDFKNKV